MIGLSLFSGVGGLDLAFEWAGGTVAAMCEIDPFRQKVLRKYWPDVPLLGDVKEVKGADGRELGMPPIAAAIAQANVAREVRNVMNL